MDTDIKKEESKETGRLKHSISIDDRIIRDGGCTKIEVPGHSQFWIQINILIENSKYISNYMLSLFWFYTALSFPSQLNTLLLFLDYFEDFMEG